MKNIAVIFGGKTVEHDISIITGLQVMSNLKDKHFIVPIYISRDGVWLTGQNLTNISSYKNFCAKNYKNCYFKPHSKFLFVKSFFKTKKQKIDGIVLALHGANGEDGSIQGLLELSGIPHTSSGILGSAITMDKAVLKMLLMQNGIKTPKFVSFFSDEYQKNKKAILEKIEQDLGKYVVVKPDRAGSSIGVCVCKTKSELENGIELAKCYDNKIIVEELVEDFREVNIACLGNKNEVHFSSLEEVVFKNGILSFDEKYIDAHETKRIVGPKIAKNVEEKIKEYAKKAFYVCEMSGVCRMDFFVKKDGEVMLNEINSIPGSMANYLFKDMSFCEFLEKLLSVAEQKFEEREQLTYLYNSSALINFENSNGKMNKNK